MHVDLYNTVCLPLIVFVNSFSEFHRQMQVSALVCAFQTDITVTAASASYYRAYVYRLIFLCQLDL